MVYPHRIRVWWSVSRELRGTRQRPTAGDYVPYPVYPGYLLEPHVFELRAELARRLGDEAAAEGELRKAYRLFTDTGATGHAARVARMLEGHDT